MHVLNFFAKICFSLSGNSFYQFESMIMNQLLVLAFIKPTQDHLTILSELGRRTFSETFVGKGYYTQELIDDYADVAFAEDRLAAELNQNKIQYYLIQVDGEFCGYIKITERDLIPCVQHLNALYLDRFYLTKEFHRRGLGSVMLAKVYEEARLRGYSYLWLSVWEHNYPALSFYGKHGFVRAGEWDWVFESKGKKYIDLDYIYTIAVPPG